MKNTLKKQVIELLTGKSKKDILIVNTFNCDPGFYRYNDKIISEAEFLELKKGYETSIVFSPVGKTLNKTDETDINVECPDIETVETLIKLRNI